MLNTTKKDYKKEDIKIPLYCFECNSCANKFEIIQKVNDPLPLCDKCNGKTKKVLAPFSFVLKGSCWARDSYNRKSNNK